MFRRVCATPGSTDQVESVRSALQTTTAQGVRPGWHVLPMLYPPCKAQTPRPATATGVTRVLPMQPACHVPPTRGVGLAC